MTKRANLRRAWHRLLASKRGRVELGAFGLSVVLLAAVAFEVAPALADPEKLAGQPVPDQDVAPIVSAALSCPTLNPPRVAAQIMAASGFADGTDGIAGMDDDAWSKWKPAADAQRSDPQANILALAHRTCELVGQVRAKKLDGDLWQLAVAADHGSLSAVEAAGGVPKSEQSYVDKVTAYSYWYADQPQFNLQATQAAATPSAGTEAAAASVTVTKVPEDLVADVNAAGRICPTITPPRIAAQLFASSNFNANLRNGDGEGIAQFTDDLWAQYRTSKKTSVWNPADAIATLGSAMCDLSNQFSGLSGDTPYMLALGAFQWGADVIRQANGLPRANVPQLADQVQKYVADYQSDTRLTTRTEPSPSATPSASAKPSAKPSASSTLAANSASPAPTSPKPAASLYDPAKTYQLQDTWAGAIVEAPGDNVTGLASGTRVQLWTNQQAKDQFWKIAPAKDSPWVTITNNFDGMNLAVENASKDNASKLVLLTKNADDLNQQWKLTDAGDGAVWIENRNSGKVMDLLGDDLAPPNSDGTWNGYLVEQWDKQTYAHDQRWLLIGS